MRSKAVALALLALLSFVGPFAEVLVSGTIEPYGKWELAETFVALVLIFWWYHVDKAEHGYRAGPLMNGGMLLAVVVAMPIYFVRSRGWKRGARATLVGMLVFGVLYGLGEAGEYLGATVSGRGRPWAHHVDDREKDLVRNLFDSAQPVLELGNADPETSRQLALVAGDGQGLRQRSAVCLSRAHLTSRKKWGPP